MSVYRTIGPLVLFANAFGNRIYKNSLFNKVYYSLMRLSYCASVPSSLVRGLDGAVITHLPLQPGFEPGYIGMWQGSGCLSMVSGFHPVSQVCSTK